MKLCIVDADLALGSLSAPSKCWVTVMCLATFLHFLQFVWLPFVFKTRFLCVDQADIELTEAHLPLLSEYWN